MRTLFAVQLILLFGSIAWTSELAPRPANHSSDGPVKEGFYIEPGVSALIFTGPERSIPVIEISPPTSRRLLDPVEEKDVTPAARLAFGYVFKDMPSWLGKSFRVEGSGNFWFAESEEHLRVPQVPVGFAMLFDNGTPGTAVDFSALQVSPPDVNSIIKRTSDYQYMDANLTVKTEYAASDLISFAPSLAFTYATLDYDAKTVSDSNVETYRLTEHLDSVFFGATVGLDVNFKPFERFTFSAGGSISPLWSSTDLDADNSWEPTGFPGTGVMYHFSDKDHEFTFRATGTGSVTYEALSWFKVTAFGGVEYWDRIARIDYPEYAPGVVPFITPNTGFPRIGYGNMTNFRAGLNFTFIIGK